MADREKNVLVFGPTGAVGRAAAIEASRRGAKVWLAMRDTSKEIQGLSEDKEGNPGFTRIQADLTQPDSLKHAVKESGATSAFVYTIWGSEDHMLASFTALKEAGITYIVLLSSYGVVGSPHDEANFEEFIPRLHAHTEISLEKSGIPYVAIRPAYFSSNIFWNTPDIKKGGEVEILHPSIPFDYIVPEDVGTASGAWLVERRFREGAQGSQAIPLCGPDLMSQKEAIDVVGRAIGREIKVKDIGEEAFSEKHQHLPRPVVVSIASTLRKSLRPNSVYPRERYQEGAANLRKYIDTREPTRFVDWIGHRKAAFS